MSWSSVIILVRENDFEEAESAALQVFETEGIIVCDGSYEIELDLFKVEENPNNYFFVTIKYHH